MTQEQFTLRRCSDCDALKLLTAEHWIPTKDLSRHPSGFLHLCRPCRNQRKRIWHAKVKLDCLTIYGGDPPRCACCDERNVSFLTIDHANEDGTQHRIEVRTFTIYGWLKRHGWPRDRGIQVLCFNCNLGRRLNGGTCPHQT